MDSRALGAQCSCTGLPGPTRPLTAPPPLPRRLQISSHLSCFLFSLLFLPPSNPSFLLNPGMIQRIGEKYPN